MKTEKKRQRNLSAFKNAPFLAPHRTIDESPVGDPDSTRHAGLRDPLRAPGQVGRDLKKKHQSQIVDELYDGTEMANLRTKNPAEHPNESKSEPERRSSSHSSDPRTQTEKKAEKEKKGLDREFGN